MNRIPILRLGHVLLVSIQLDLEDTIALGLQEDLAAAVAKWRAQGVLIDISAVELVDSFIGRTLANIASMTRVLGAETVLVGMRPAVAITMVELGLALPGIKTALDVDRGMELLRAL
jgi:rsbT antagonist protein RsbS